MTALNPPPNGPQWDYTKFKDWFFKLWRSVTGMTFGADSSSYSAAVGASAASGEGLPPAYLGNPPAGYGTTLGYTSVLIGLSAPGDGAVGVALLPANQKNQIIKTSSFSDAGSSTTATVLTNVQGSAFNYTPASTNSFLNVIYAFAGGEGILANTNTVASFAIFETTSGNVQLSSTYNLDAVTATIGVSATSPCAIMAVNVSNTSTATRSFELFAATNNASAAATGTLIRCIIQEVSNQ